MKTLNSKNYLAEVIGRLNEVDYMIAAVENVSKNSKYLGIEVDEKLLRERLNLLMSSRFTILFTKKPVNKHQSLPNLNINDTGTSASRPRSSYSSSNNRRSGLIHQRFDACGPHSILSNLVKYLASFAQTICLGAHCRVQAAVAPFYEDLVRFAKLGFGVQACPVKG